MECYDETREPDDDDPLYVNIPYYEGMCAVEGLDISSDQFFNPLKVMKINIGSPKNPKFMNIGDYWEDEIIGKFTDLLYEFQDLFLTKLS